MSQNVTWAGLSFSSTSTNVGGKVSGTRQTKHVTSDSSGTTVKTTSQNLGEAPVREVRHFDSRGHEVAGGAAGDANRRIEDAGAEEQAKDKQE